MQVIANTECNFKKLTVEQVLPLFKEFKFWTTEVSSMALMQTPFTVIMDNHTHTLLDLLIKTV